MQPKYQRENNDNTGPKDGSKTVICPQNGHLPGNIGISDNTRQKDCKQLEDFDSQLKKSGNDKQVYCTEKLECDMDVRTGDTDSASRLEDLSPKQCKNNVGENPTEYIEEEIQGQGRESSVKSTIEDLEDEHTSENMWDCSICLKKFKTKRMLYFHTRFKHKDPTSCDICKLSFTSKVKFQIHTKKVHGDEMRNEVICHKCGKNLSGNLKRHLSVCNKPKIMKKKNCNMKIQCTYCNKSVLKSSMKRHMTRKHQIVVRRGSSFYYTNITAKYKHTQKSILYFCNICSVSFTRKYNLTKHNKLFHSETKGTKMNIKSDFVIWERVGKDVKPRACTKCKMMFNDGMSLRKHSMEEHPLQDSFQCSQCTKRYKSKKILRNHELLDHSGNIFYCTLCEYSSKRKYDLKRHSKVHTNERKPLKDIEELSRKSKRIKKIAQDVNVKLSILPHKDKNKIIKYLMEQNTDKVNKYSQCPLDEEDVIGMVKDVNLSDRQVLQILTKIRAKWGNHIVTPNIKSTLKERKQIVSHLYKVELLEQDDMVHFLGKDDIPITR